MKKRKVLIPVIIAIIVLVCAGLIWFFTQNVYKREVKPENRITVTPVVEMDVTPNFDATKEGIEHELRLSIIEPADDVIYPGQARMYNALIDGNGKYSNPINCSWKFYLNENNKEVLYQEMKNSGVLSGSAKEICGFTSTFIDKIGTLRVELSVTVYDAVNPNLETVTAEREFVVSK